MHPNTVDGESIVLRALLDSGASSTIIAKNILQGFKFDHAPQSQVWATPAGDMTTNQMVKLRLHLMNSNLIKRLAGTSMSQLSRGTT